LRQSQVYRVARRAFIAACEAAGVDPIARVHPGKAADGKPLFMDSAALGPRQAAKALLVVARDAAGSAVLAELLRVPLPRGARLVLVHALDPAAFAGGPADPAWASAMLGAVATEDLAKVRALGVLPLDSAQDLRPALAGPLPAARITQLAPAAGTCDAKAAITDFFGG
jgi:hypothetical protein